MNRTLDISGLTAEEKRQLLSRLLMEQAQESAEVHPMSYGQRSLWFLYQLAPGSPAYTVTYAGRITGTLDVPALERAAQALVDRHAVLRTTYSVRDGGQPVQLVHPRWPIRVDRHDVGSDEVDEWLRRECNRTFDLQTGPVLRLNLLRVAPDNHLVVLSVHHIAVDFWSIDVMLDELRLLYAAEHGAPPPPPCPVRYADEVAWQSRLVTSVEGERLWDYWRERLAGEPPVLQLPIDRPRPAAQSYRGAVHRFTMDHQLAEGIKQVGRAAGATPFATLLAAYAALLSRYSGQDDIFIGSPFACRERPGLDTLVGYVANPVVLRADLSGDPSFTSLLGRIKDTVLGAIAHQDYPFALLVERLRPARDLSRTPLFQVSFVWEQPRRFQKGRGRAELDLQTVHIGQAGAPLDLMMQVGDTDGTFTCSLQYNTDLFDEATIERMAGHFATLLEGIVADPRCRISDLPLLTAAEQRMQSALNSTQVSYDAPECLHQIVAATAHRLPDAIAVSCDGRDVTYAELEARAQALALVLRSFGVGPDVIVPVLLDRSEDLVVALLGILKAGGAFMPLDPGQPDNRLAAMLADAPDLRVCVTHTRYLDRVPAFTGHRLCLDLPPTPAPEGTVVTTAPTSRSLAYVIHTSGSTGAPKGALNTHAGIRNRLLWMQDTYRLTPDDRVLHKTPMTFDASVWEIFWPLIAGARVVIAKPDGHKDLAYLVHTIVEQGITTVHFVPSLLRSLLAEPALRYCVGLRTVLCAGEVLPYELAQRFMATLDAQLWNEYGPTEAAIGVTCFRCRPGAPGPTIPIGRPIANIQIHLVDAHLHPVPVGVPGELCIGGIGVGRGYLNKPEATAARFLRNPFDDGAGGLLYRTGDVARYTPDGNIEYLGRLDDQVKIRGVRIEPGEVEAALLHHPAIMETAVVAGKDGKGNTLLVAHVATGATQPTSADLRRFLLDQLPAAMVPSVFCLTDALPHTSSGKIDRVALTAAGENHTATVPFVGPRTEVERILAEIWSAVLDLDRVGVHDDFFALGGSSTHSLEVSVLANEAGLQLTPESVFLCGTIAELAAVSGPDVVGNADIDEHTRIIDTSEADVTAVPTEPRVRMVGRRTRNTVIESLGTYLPATTVSTEAVLDGCANDIGIPLERLTGIRNRRMAGQGEFSIDLARQAVTDCLARSSAAPEEIDLVICCNISRCDGPGHRVTYEPSTAIQLREECGFINAFAFDVSNACAGMFTGIAVADAFLQTELVQRAIVISGEYITHLTESAQREIEGPMDSRLACLTLGDAGAAVILERGPNNRVGFHDIDMATLGRYSSLCVAKATNDSHGGAIMFCDSIAGTAVAVKRSVPYVTGVMQRHGWRPETCDHIIMHQTSEASLNDAVAAVNRMYGRPVAHPGNTIYNLAERGNTASTTHFIALRDHILGNRIKSGDNAVFGITGSGQTIGAALYTFDDLPDRLRRGPDTQPARRRSTGRRFPAPPGSSQVRIAGVGTARADRSGHHTAVDLATRAAVACLDDSGIQRNAVDLIIHAGLYRDDFICEPAAAAMIAGELGANDDIESPDGPKTFAFDLLNGAVGFLNACHVGVQMIGSGKADHVMIVAADIEHNTPESAQPRYGLIEMGSAVLLSRADCSTDADSTVGFGHFVFHHHAEYVDALVTSTRHLDDHTWLQIERDPKLAALYLDCIPPAVEEILQLEELDRTQIAAVFPPFLTAGDRAELAARIGIPEARLIGLGVEGDPFTSAVPYGIEQARQRNLLVPGDIGLIISVGSGLQVGCVTHRF